jgi:hypothetical protein
MCFNKKGLKTRQGFLPHSVYTIYERKSKPLVIQLHPSTVYCSLFLLNTTLVSSNWFLATVVSRNWLQATSFSQRVFCLTLHRPLQILQFSAFIRPSFACHFSSQYISHWTHVTAVCPFTGFLFDLPRYFFLTTCQIVCKCWMTLSTNTICPAF